MARLPLHRSVERLADRFDLDEFDSIGHIRWRAIPRRKDTPRESHLGGLADAQWRLRRAADLPRQPDFTEHRRPLLDGTIPHTGGDGRYDAQIGGRLIHRHASRDIDE